MAFIASALIAITSQYLLVKSAQNWFKLLIGSDFMQ